MYFKVEIFGDYLLQNLIGRISKKQQHESGVNYAVIIHETNIACGYVREENKIGDTLAILYSTPQST